MGDVFGLGLAEVIERLRAELVTAHAQSLEADIRFPIDGLSVELQVAVTLSADGKAEFRIPFTGIGASLGGGGEHERLQKVTLNLKGPVDRNNVPVAVSADSKEEKD
jgi:hypothetical protein